LEQDTTLNAFRALGAAADWTSFRAALALFVAPAANFAFADSVTGDIGC
jgi:acyl-homoserine lactone acylase PvdQ